MGRISSGVGLISGINSKDIIDQLMALEARPKDLLQTRIDGINQQKLAYTDLSTRLTSLKINSTALKKPSTFQAATATSGDEDVFTATAGNGSAVGSFQLQVAGPSTFRVPGLKSVRRLPTCMLLDQPALGWGHERYVDEVRGS